MDKLYKQLNEAVRTKNSEEYKAVTKELLDLGYLPKLNEEKAIELVFVGPVSNAERTSHDTYLTNLFTTLTEKEEVDDDKNKGTSTNAIVALGLVGAVIVAIVALTLNSRKQVYHSYMGHENDLF